MNDEIKSCATRLSDLKLLPPGDLKLGPDAIKKKLTLKIIELGADNPNEFLSDLRLDAFNKPKQHEQELLKNFDDDEVLPTEMVHPSMKTVDQETENLTTTEGKNKKQISEERIKTNKIAQNG